jgi:hypothetical protein
MPKKQSDDLTRKGDKKQRTDKGLTIPVPEREDFLRNLGKVAPPATQPEESEKEPHRKRRAES